MPDKQLKVLVIAFAAKPNDGSEYAVGWTWLNEIAKVSDQVTVLIRDAEGQKEAIHKYIQGSPLENVEFLFYELPGFLKNIVKGEIQTKQTGMRRYYLLWQLFSIFFLKRALDLNKFDIVHHVTFVSDWLPSFYTLLGVRHVVLGPLGSNSHVPLALGYPAKIIFVDWVSNLIKFIFRWFNPLYRYNMLRADALIGISPDTRGKIGTKLLSNKFYHIPPVSVPEGLKPNPAHFPKSLDSNDDLIIFLACPFIYCKNINMAIEAFARYLKINPKSKFYIAGDGPLRTRLLALTAELNIEDYVFFLGWIKMNEVLQFLKDKAHIFLFPTSESGGTVSVEAMRCGVPVVCLKGYGYNYFIKNSNGSIAVPIKNRNQIINDMAAAINVMAHDLFHYSINAYEESKVFLPNRKGELLSKIYSSFINKEN